MTSSAAPPTEKTGRHQRSMRNYLIDSRFQLKYTGFIVSVTLAVSIVLGFFLWSTSNQVVAESKTVSDIVKMQIKDDPVYGDNPELSKSFTDASSDFDQRILSKQRAMRISVAGGLALLVILIGLLGIYYTHKVAGPIYKMKLLLNQVGAGKLTFRSALRKGDELQEFFETFQSMVDNLKERQAKEVALLDAGIEAAKEAGATEISLEKITKLRAQMQRALEE